MSFYIICKPDNNTDSVEAEALMVNLVTPPQYLIMTISNHAPLGFTVCNSFILYLHIKSKLNNPVIMSHTATLRQSLFFGFPSVSSIEAHSYSRGCTLTCTFAISINILLTCFSISLHCGVVTNSTHLSH